MQSSKLEKTKVLSISAYASDLAEKKSGIFSGAQKRQLDYAEFLELYIVIVPGKKNGKAKLADNFYIYTVKAKNTLSFIFKAYFLANILIKKYNIDIISADNPFSSGPVAAFLKMRHKKQLIINQMADMIDNPHYLKERRANSIKNMIAKLAVKKADLLRVSTEAEILRLEKSGYSNVFNAPFYIDFKAFESAEFNLKLRNELLKDKFDNIVLYIGRFSTQKDLPVYLRAIKETIKTYPKTLFVFIGHGPLYDIIIDKAREEGIFENTLFLGKVAYGEVPAYYKISDIFCTTSIYEGTCMTLHEAAICGLPIVATDFAGAKDLIKNGENGYLSEIGDHLAAADNIKKLLAEKEMRIIMGNRNKEIVKSFFSREKALEKHRKMYKLIYRKGI